MSDKGEAIKGRRDHLAWGTMSSGFVLRKSGDRSWAAMGYGLTESEWKAVFDSLPS